MTYTHRDTFAGIGINSARSPVRRPACGSSGLTGCAATQAKTRGSDTRHLSCGHYGMAAAIMVWSPGSTFVYNLMGITPCRLSLARRVAVSSPYLLGSTKPRAPASISAREVHLANEAYQVELLDLR